MILHRGGHLGPEARVLPLYFPLLEQIGSSFAINDQYARRYIQAGLENLRRLQQKTRAAVQDLNQARAQFQQDREARQERKEYMDSKWDDYRRDTTTECRNSRAGRCTRPTPAAHRTP